MTEGAPRMTDRAFDGWAATVTWVAVVLLYAALSSVWTAHDPGWYAGLAKPSFQPPDVVFGIMWPLNFLALLVVVFGSRALRRPLACGPRRWSWRPRCSLP
jgi:hypothetical protein